MNKKGHYIINVCSHESRTKLINYLLSEGFTLDSWQDINEAYRVSFPIVVDISTMRFQYSTSTVHAAAAASYGFTEIEKFYEDYSIIKEK